MFYVVEERKELKGSLLTLKFTFLLVVIFHLIIVRLLVPFEMFSSANFGLSWVMPRWVVDLYVWWWIVGNTRCVTMWKMVLSAFVSFVGLRKESNDRNRNFEDCERTLEEIKFLFFNTLYLWQLPFFFFFFFLFSFSD